MKDTGPAFLSVSWNPEKESDHRAGGGDWVGHMGLRGLSKHSDKGARSAVRGLFSQGPFPPTGVGSRYPPPPAPLNSSAGMGVWR